MDLNQLLHQHQLALMLANRLMPAGDRRASLDLVHHYEHAVIEHRERRGLVAYRRNANLTAARAETAAAAISQTLHSVDAPVPIERRTVAVQPGSKPCNGEVAQLETLAELGIEHRIIDIYEIGGICHTSLADALAHARRLRGN